MSKINRIFKEAEKIENEEKKWLFIESEIKKIYDELSDEEIGRFFDETTKGVKKFEEKVNKFIIKQKKKTKQ